MTLYSELPEFYRRVKLLEQVVTGVPTGTPNPFWPEDGNNELLCIWTPEEITRLLSAIRVGADLIYPDISHTVEWSFLRQLEFPNELSEGDAVQKCVIRHNEGVAGNGGAVSSGDNVYGVMTEMTRNDIPGVSHPNETVVYLPAGDYHVEHWHTIRDWGIHTYMRPYVYLWAVPTPQYYYRGGLFRTTVTGQSYQIRGTADFTIDNTYPMNYGIWSQNAMTNVTTLGQGVAGQESVFGEIVIEKIPD